LPSPIARNKEGQTKYKFGKLSVTNFEQLKCHGTFANVKEKSKKRMYT